MIERGRNYFWDKIRPFASKYQHVSPTAAAVAGGAGDMSENVDHQASLIPSQPTMLVFGDRRVKVDEWPIARYAEENRRVELVRAADSLVIEPQPWTVAKTALLILAGVAPGLLLLLLQVPPWLAASVSISILVVVAWITLRTLRWIRFDRQSKQLILERKLSFRKERQVEGTYPLESILAVQLLCNGRHSITETQTGGAPGGGDSSIHRDYFGYEMNLILKDSSTPRLNLLCLADWKWIRETGRQIGEFLGVPVIDKLHHGE